MNKTITLLLLLTPIALTAQNPFPNSHFADVKGMTLHYRIWEPVLMNNALSPVLMVHGMGASTWSWEENVPALTAEGFRVIAVDVPPFGFSGKDPDFDQSVANRALLLWDLLQGLDSLSTWNLVGHSMGGGIVQAMAVLHPERVRKVVFVDPALFTAQRDYAPRGSGLLRFRPFEWVAVGLGKVFLLREKKIRELLTSAYGSEPDSADVAEYHRALSQRGFARAFLRSSVNRSVIPPLDGTRFSSPALAIWGDRDTWVPLDSMRETLRQLPSIQLTVIEGAGHCPMNTHPTQFNSLMTTFLHPPNHLNPPNHP